MQSIENTSVNNYILKTQASFIHHHKKNLDIHREENYINYHQPHSDIGHLWVQASLEALVWLAVSISLFCI